MLPFTVDQFLHVFEQYNQAIWPMQIAAYILGIAALALVATKTRYSDRAISVILAFFWAWVGIVYQLMFFSTINGAALGFGVLFIVQGVLWLVFGVIRPKLSFHWETNRYTLIGAVMIVYAMLVYPVLGALLGHGYPRSPSFGVAPCPMIIFTFGLLLLTNAKVPKSLLVIPFLWSLLGVSASYQLGVREDIGLLVAGVLGVGLLIWRDRAPVHIGSRSAHA
jgi:MFS family permease